MLVDVCRCAVGEKDEQQVEEDEDIEVEVVGGRKEGEDMEVAMRSMKSCVLVKRKDLDPNSYVCVCWCVRISC